MNRIIVAILSHASLLLVIMAEKNSGREAQGNPLSQFRNAIGERSILQGPGATLTVSPDILYGEGGFVTVTWENYSYAGASDWIGMICPASATPYTTGPVLFRFLGSPAQNIVYDSSTKYIPSTGNMVLFFMLNFY